MSAIDITILIVAGAALVYGLIKGIINQLASLGGFVLGLIACRIFGDNMAEIMTGILPGTFHSQQAASIVGNIVLFLLVYFTVALIASMAHKLTHAIMIGWLDHLLGGIFSVFKWLLIMSIVLNLWHIITPDSPIFHSFTLMDGELFPALMNFAPKMLSALAGQVSATIDNVS